MTYNYYKAELDYAEDVDGIREIMAGAEIDESLCDEDYDRLYCIAEEYMEEMEMEAEALEHEEEEAEEEPKCWGMRDYLRYIGMEEKDFQ